MFRLVTFAASSQGPRRNSLRVARTRSKSSNTSINVVAWMWRSCTSPLLYAASALMYQDGARFAKAWVSLIHLLSMTHWHNTWRVTSTRSYKYEGWWLRLGAAARRSSQAVRTDDIGYQVRSLEELRRLWRYRIPGKRLELCYLIPSFGGLTISTLPWKFLFSLIISTMRKGSSPYRRAVHTLRQKLPSSSSKWVPHTISDKNYFDSVCDTRSTF